MVLEDCEAAVSSNLENGLSDGVLSPFFFFFFETDTKIIKAHNTEKESNKLR